MPTQANDCRSRCGVPALFTAVVMVAAACSGGADELRADDAEPGLVVAGEPAADELAADEDVDGAVTESGAGEASLEWFGDPDGAGFIREPIALSDRSTDGLIVGEIGLEPVIMPADVPLTTSAIGTPLTLRVPDGVRLEIELIGELVLADAADPSIFPFELLGIFRDRGVVDPSMTESHNGGPFNASDRIATVSEFVAEADALTEAVEDVLVGGVPAVKHTISVDPAAGPTLPYCDGPCVFLFPDWMSVPLVAIDGYEMLVWEIGQAPFADIMITARVPTDDPTAWGPRVDSIIESMTFGEPAPDPLGGARWELGRNATVPAGTVSLPILGGVSFEIPRVVDLMQTGDWVIMYDFESPFVDFPPNVEVTAMATTLDGLALESVDDAVQLLVDRASGEVAGTTEVVGQPATIVELRGVLGGRPIFSQNATDDAVAREAFFWYTQDWVRFYVFERGGQVMAVTAEADSEASWQVAKEFQDLVVDTLVFDN